MISQFPTQDAFDQVELDPRSDDADFGFPVENLRQPPPRPNACATRQQRSLWPVRELRSRPQSQGGYSQPPRRNAQAFDAVCKRVNVAGRRCYRASDPVRPRWDQAVPCCFPLTGWASGPVAASRPSEAAASSCLSEGGRVLLGSTHWQNYFPAHAGSGWDDETPPCRVRWRAHDGASAASPSLCLRPKSSTGCWSVPMSLSLLPASGPMGPCTVPRGLDSDEGGGLAGCAQAGAENASAAITATPLKRYFVFIRNLRCRTVRQAARWGGPHERSASAVAAIRPPRELNGAPRCTPRPIIGLS